MREEFHGIIRQENVSAHDLIIEEESRTNVVCATGMVFSNSAASVPLVTHFYRLHILRTFKCLSLLKLLADYTWRYNLRVNQSPCGWKLNAMPLLQFFLRRHKGP